MSDRVTDRKDAMPEKIWLRRRINGTSAHTFHGHDSGGPHEREIGTTCECEPYIRVSKHEAIVSALTKERDALKAKFVRYGSHIVGCDALNYLPSSRRSETPCTCGWREAIE